MASPAPIPKKSSRAPKRKGVKNVNLSPDDRISLYSQSRYLSDELARKFALQIPFATYFQDPFVAQSDPRMALDTNVDVSWEPGLADGPTSSRFAVVDYNADTGKLEPPAVWDEASQKFTGPGGAVLDATATASFQFPSGQRLGAPAARTG